MREINARFWIYWRDGFVKLTLRPGECVRLEASSRTEEGWEAEGETLRFDGAKVRRDWWRDGRDCDGRLSEEGRLVCSLLDLRAKTSTDPDIMMPQWRDVPRSYARRDYAAEAAGY